MFIRLRRWLALLIYPEVFTRASRTARWLDDADKEIERLVRERDYV
jgi:hypothetical protein